ncbi:MAG: HU family DNA-binding protein [Ignavibacteria bacterium]|nr:HU family DNA-binding protein [Ignavibacteria bacterium]
MNRNSLLNRIRIKSTYTRELANNIFDFTFSEIRKGILNNRSILIDEFGVFESEHRKMTTVTDLKMKTEVLLPPKDRLIFKPSEELIKTLKD